MFDTVLVANRGEIAVRVIRTLREMGIRSVAVYSDADRDARHVAEADIAVHIGPSLATESYLNGKKIIEVARQVGAEAIHPGYGFLAENADFARACAEANVDFIGPRPDAIERMGDKIRAKRTVSAAGVPVVPGRSDPGMTDAELREAAIEIGFPVLIKPSAGGGGKGMRLVHGELALDDEIASARREARNAFGDDTLFIERFVTNPRHIEVQILADGERVVHLGERECSLQRRHQKIIEEAPSPLLDAETRARIGASAVDAARAVGYIGAGTVEFIVSADRPDEFFFMEMNTRLQVEHPVTELVTTAGGRRGVDLVEQQIRIADGHGLPWAQDELGMEGHAVEARVYAEDPSRRFLPTGGELLLVREPTGPGVRVDSGVRTGDRVGSDYDPMLAKVVAWAPDREEALVRLGRALTDTAILGLNTNIEFLTRLLQQSDVVEGDLDTGLVERELASLLHDGFHDEVCIAAALQRLITAQPAAGSDPWEVPNGWRIGAPGWSTWRFVVGDPADLSEVTVHVQGTPEDAHVLIEGGRSADEPALAVSATADGDTITINVDGRISRFRYAHAGDATWLTADGQTWALTEHTLLAEHGDAAGRSDGLVTAPMPGTVLVSDVAPGQRVQAGQRLFVVEAMKMEHTVTAPIDGTVSEVHARKGQSVGLDQPLAALVAETEA